MNNFPKYIPPYSQCAVCKRNLNRRNTNKSCCISSIIKKYGMSPLLFLTSMNYKINSFFKSIYGTAFVDMTIDSILAGHYSVAKTKKDVKVKKYRIPTKHKKGEK